MVNYGYFSQIQNVKWESKEGNFENLGLGKIGESGSITYYIISEKLLMRIGDSLLYFRKNKLSGMFLKSSSQNYAFYISTFTCQAIFILYLTLNVTQTVITFFFLWYQVSNPEPYICKLSAVLFSYLFRIMICMYIQLALQLKFNKKKFKHELKQIDSSLSLWKYVCTLVHCLYPSQFKILFSYQVFSFVFSM